tara:strand:- start:44 stop:145 length:102 start_codon:yes stop_codon:yes gene_type:complete
MRAKDECKDETKGAGRMKPKERAEDETKGEGRE